MLLFFKKKELLYCRVFTFQMDVNRNLMCGAKGGYPTMLQPATSHCLDREARDVQRPEMEVASGA